ncbi:hypothetical protein EPICR_150056 [Candidatus Desulfarcum epimagneticum]|uniref:Uncharacterized protein n=1 Tax=uncultured Desulfobacteraceae bacterium TaxID=218296 RepID=A0A484HFR3_9BACT|nr:hypothetical protein EPICR_150056 [uncultured Desulfobacteraceae bacterium]
MIRIQTGVSRNKDGRTFALIPEKMSSSPLDVPSIQADITTQEIVNIIREGRERGRARTLDDSAIKHY